MPQEAQTFVSAKVHAYVLSALDFMGKYGINASSQRWKRARAEALKSTASDTKYSETYGALMWAVWAAGDPVHSSFHSPAGANAISQQLGNGSRLPSVRVSRPGIVKLTLPTYVGQDAAKTEAYVEAGVDSLLGSARSASCGWIVDLRDDGGGNVYPMLAAASPLLAQGRLISYVDRNQRVTWVSLKGSTVRYEAREAAERVSVSVPTKTSTLSGRPIAVLQGTDTASSGEAALLAFKVQARVRTFGTTTAGLASANVGKTMRDGAVLTLTSAWTSNQTGIIYKHGIPADTPTSTDASTVAAASQWLKSECGG